MLSENAITGYCFIKLSEYRFDAWSHSYNCTGRSYSNVPADFLVFRGYTGHEHLDVFNLINMNGCVYDPYLGMFLSPDNYVQMPDATQGFNRYAYCFNNPLIMTDPSGDFIFSLYLGPVGAIIDAACWGAVINGGIYAVSTAITGQKWDWEQFGKSVAVGAISGAAGAGAGMLTQGLQVYGAIPGALIEGGIQGVAGGLAGGFGNVIMEDDWRAFGSGFAQGFITGFILGGISGGIEGYINAQNIGANPYTGKLYINQNTYSTPQKAGIPLQANPDEGCYASALEYADNGRGNHNAAYYRRLAGGAAGADAEQVARTAGIRINAAGRINNVVGYEQLGQQLRGGKEVLGAMGRDGVNHWVNITEIVTADKLRIVGGGYRRGVQSTSIWDPIVGHTSGPTSFFKILSLF